ncbi:MAG: ABC transporter ATP-binding protein [Phycisphaerales bacterium]
MIETRDIRVDYGDLVAVTDVSMDLPPGAIHGLIGPNGAGKSSLIRVLATLQEPTYGTATVAGYDSVQHRAEVRRRLGYMPDLAPVDDELTCWEFLDLFAAAHGLSRRDRKRRIGIALDVVSLSDKASAMAGTLSRGMTQRLVLAKTLLHDPDVLLLDEPASGLDPIARIELRELLKRLGEAGKTVIISSHILGELASFCTSIGIMESGQMVVHGEIESLLAQVNRDRRFRLTALDVHHAAAAAAALDGRVAVGNVHVDDRTVAFEFSESDDAGVARLLAELIAADVAVTGLLEDRVTIEDVLLERQVDPTLGRSVLATEGSDASEAADGDDATDATDGNPPAGGGLAPTPGGIAGSGGGLAAGSASGSASGPDRAPTPAPTADADADHGAAPESNAADSLEAASDVDRTARFPDRPAADDSVASPLEPTS